MNCNQRKVSSGLQYTVCADGKSCEISGIGTCTDEDIVIPREMDGLTVTGIAKKAFYSQRHIISVTVPETVTRIDSFAFQLCMGMKRIYLPKSVTQIGVYAFLLCKELERAELPPLAVLERGLFFGCYALAEAVFPETVTKICMGAFFGCKNLAQIEIPPSVAVVEPLAFHLCHRFRSVTVASTLTSIGIGAFSSENMEQIRVSEKNPAYTSLDGSLYSKDMSSLLQYACGQPKNVFVLPEQVRSIAPLSCKSSKSLTRVVMPDSLTQIGDAAFRDCTQLQSVCLGASVTQIGDRAFADCESLTEIRYNGTMSQWQNLAKGSDWDCDTGNYTVICTDGTISKK